MRRRLPFAVLLATTLPAQEPAAPDPLARIAAAEKRLATRAPDEEATQMLWEAERQLLAAAPGFARDAALATAANLLAKADPHAALRAQVRTDTARKVVEIAALYRQKKWFDLAEERLRVAERFDIAAAAKERAAVQAARAAQKPAAPAASAPAPAPKKGKDEIAIGTLKLFQSEGNWRIDDGVVFAPPDVPNLEPVYWLSDTEVDDREISCEILIPEGKGMAAVMFGAASAADVFMATYEKYDQDNGCVRLEKSHPDRVEAMQLVRGELKKGTQGWQRLTIRVRGDQIAVDLNDTIRCGHQAARAAHGRIGFLIVGSGAIEPPRFRNLAVRPLPEKAPSAEQKRAQVQQDRQQGLFAAVQRGEELLKQKQHEAGVRELRAAQAEVRLLEAAALRDSLETTIDKLLAQADVHHARRKKAAQEIAAAFAGLAERYLEAGMLTCAHDAADEAAAFDPAGRAALVQKVDQAIAARDAAEAVARAKELEPPPLDDALLAELFGRGRPLFRGGTAWTVDGAGARVQGLADGTFSAWLPGKPSAGGRFAVHLHMAKARTAAGFAFDAHGDNDFGVVLLVRGENKLTLAVHRYLQGRWQQLQQVQVPCPTWRLAGWFELQIETGPDGLKVRIGETAIAIERGKLGALGPIGLCAEAVGDGQVEVVMRGLRRLP